MRINKLDTLKPRIKLLTILTVKIMGTSVLKNPDVLTEFEIIPIEAVKRPDYR